MASNIEIGVRTWTHVRKVIERKGPFCHPDFEPNSELLNVMQSDFKILVIGCGGLGCELLKDLALMGFVGVSAIDMDTIELSNLNRQFLFKESDIGKSKAEVAAVHVNEKVPGARVKAHHCKIQDMDADFYRQFHVIVSGLDSIVARRWINSMLVDLLNYEDGVLDQTSMIPLIDGGSEGFKGNARVILPGISPCIECTLDLYPPQINYPLCTIANTPRLPEHCIEYVKIIQWEKEKPFGDDVNLDGDDSAHIQWIYKKSLDRAQKFNIQGVTYRLTQGVIKRIIPAVATTNAIIAASCATEVFKLVIGSIEQRNNYMIFNDTDGIYTYSYKGERNKNCLTCSRVPQEVIISFDEKLKSLYETLIVDERFQFKSPSLTSIVNGEHKTLYMKSIDFLEKKTRPNLDKTLRELEFVDKQEIIVSDVTRPNTVAIVLRQKI